MAYKNDEYGAIWSNDSMVDSDDIFDGIGLMPEDDDYCDVYDESGDDVVCDICGEPMKWRESDITFVCTNCGREMSRKEFFDYAGLIPKGPECITCDELYPRCFFCPHGYIE